MDSSDADFANEARPSDAHSTKRNPVSAFDRWRGVLSRLALVVFMVSAGLAVPTIWARNQMLNTDAFVRTVAPLAGNDAFQEVVANNVTMAITREFTMSGIVTDDTGVVSTLLPMVATAATQSVANSFVTSSRFQQVWEETARISHAGFVALLNGSDSPFFDTTNGQVSVDLSPMARAVSDELSSRRINIRLPAGNLSFVIFESSTLAKLQTITRDLEELAVILTIVALGSLLAYILLSPNRRGAIAVAGLGLAIAMLVVLLLVMVLRWQYQRDLGNTVDRDAAVGMFDVLASSLRSSLRLIGLGGIIVAGVAYRAYRKDLHLESSHERRTLYEHWPHIGWLEHIIATNRVAAIGLWTAFIASLLFLLNWTSNVGILTILVGGVAGLLTMLRAELMPADQLASAPPAAAAERDSMSQRLQQVADLRSQGALSKDEFDQAKALILSGQ